MKKLSLKNTAIRLERLANRIDEGPHISEAIITLLCQIRMDAWAEVARDNPRRPLMWLEELEFILRALIKLKSVEAEAKRIFEEFNLAIAALPCPIHKVIKLESKVHQKILRVLNSAGEPITLEDFNKHFAELSYSELSLARCWLEELGCIERFENWDNSPVAVFLCLTSAGRLAFKEF